MICVVSSCHEKFSYSEYCSTYSEHRDQTMPEMVAFREIKQWKKILKPGAANVKVAYVLRVNLVEERV